MRQVGDAHIRRTLNEGRDVQPRSPYIPTIHTVFDLPLTTAYKMRELNKAKYVLFSSGGKKYSQCQHDLKIVKILYSTCIQNSPVLLQCPARASPHTSTMPSRDTIIPDLEALALVNDDQSNSSTSKTCSNKSVTDGEK